MSTLEKIQAKLLAAQNCHPSAVQTLIAEALKAADEMAQSTVAAQQPRAEGWHQYAKEGETAQDCIERHRKEQDALMTLLANSRVELGRAYRCIQSMHNALNAAQLDFPASGYHAPIIGAAKRFIFEGELDGSDYFIGKSVEVLHAALRLPEVANHG